jgi:hypothetical protein
VTVYNLLSNSSFEDELFGWDFADDNFFGEIVEDTAPDGDRYFLAACISTAPTDLNAFLFCDPVPAAAGAPLTFSAYVRGGSGGVGKTIQMQINAYSSAGASLGTTNTRPVLTSSFVRRSVTFTPPAGTAYVIVFFFDYNGTTQTFAVGNEVHVDAVMLHRGVTAETYTAAGEPLAWAGGPNYDVSALEVYTANPGFVLGESVLGDDVLGEDGGYSLRTADFTSITISDQSTVENGLFVRREVSTATLTSTNPEHLGLKGQRLWITYAGGTAVGKTLLMGTVTKARLVETVAVGAPHLRGNGDYSTHRVTLTVSNQDEYFATQPAPPRAFDSSDSLVERSRSLLDLTADGVLLDGDPYTTDVNGNIYSNANTSGFLPIVTTSDDEVSLLDRLWDQAKRYSLYYRLIPWLSRVDIESISRPASGDDTIASALRFTDNPEDITDAALYWLGGKNHAGRTVSFSQRESEEDPSLWCGEVTILANGNTYGPFTASGTAGRRQNATIDLGNLDISPDRIAATVRNFVSTLPLKVKALAFTNKITAPLQSVHQIQNRVPGIATLTRNGFDDTIAILGVTHTITPDRWLVEYDVGPPFLLTRESDYDPAPPRNLEISQVGSNVTIAWTTPEALPRDVALYRQVRHITPAAGFVGGMVPADAFFTVVHNELVADEDLGAQQSITVPTSALAGTGNGRFFVQYTTDPNPGLGIGTFSATTHRIGQPAIVDFTVS